MEKNDDKDKQDNEMKKIDNLIEQIMENDIVANQSYVDENGISDKSDSDEDIQQMLTNSDEYELTFDLDNDFSYNWEEEFFKKFEWLDNKKETTLEESNVETALHAKYQLFLDACSMLQGNFNMVNERDRVEDPHYNKLYMYFISLEDEHMFLHTDFKKEYEIVMNECLDTYDYVKLHKPQNVVFVMEIQDFYDVDKYVKMFMHMFGIENTRGGSYTDIVLQPEFIQTIEHERKITQLDYYVNTEK